MFEFTMGLLLGTIIGVFIMALCTAAKNGDKDIK